MSKNLVYWIIATFIGTVYFYISHINFITAFSRDYAKIAPWAFIEFITLPIYVIIGHILLSGKFIRVLYFSFPIIILILISRTFKILHWAGGDILLLTSTVSTIILYTIYYSKKKQKSNIDIFILIYILLDSTLSMLRLHNIIDRGTLHSLKPLTFILILIICVLHLINEYRNNKTS